jgi:hypothetical protein
MAYAEKNFEGFIMDFRNAVAARQIAERAEWAVNASGGLMLSVPHCLPSAPDGVSLTESGCTVDFGDLSFSVPVPDFISPFLSVAPTVLLVTFKRTNIVTEKDVFVRHR